MTIIKSALTVDQALGLIWTMASDPYEELAGAGEGRPPANGAFLPVCPLHTIWQLDPSDPACFPDDGTCLATEDTYILMPATGSYTKASVKTHTFHRRSSESENLTFIHSSS